MKFDEENSRRILDELMKDFEDNADKIHIDSYQLENPEDREEKILAEVKNNLKDELLKETAISKEIAFLLFRARKEGFKIKFVK